MLCVVRIVSRCCSCKYTVHMMMVLLLLLLAVFFSVARFSTGKKVIFWVQYIISGLWSVVLRIKYNKTYIASRNSCIVSFFLLFCAVYISFCFAKFKKNAKNGIFFVGCLKKRKKNARLSVCMTYLCISSAFFV